MNCVRAGSNDIPQERQTVDQQLNRHKLIFVLLWLLSVTFASTNVNAAIVLFDDTLGTLPSQQPWLLHAGFGIAEQTTPAGVRLTSSGPGQGGYSNYALFAPKNPNFPVLDRNRGFTLELELQLIAEAHSSPNRAGFSVILLGSDSKGIEIGFWEDEVWAQDDNPLFVKGETASFDTQSEEVLYAISILADRYSVAANNVEILSGDVRDYGSFGLPYTLPNFLFVGDDTTSAQSDSNLGRIQLSQTISTPEPASVFAVGIGCIGIVAGNFLRRSRRKE